MVLFLLKALPIAFVGGVLTSAAEYYFKYNLFDLLKDKIVSLFRKKPVVPPVVPPLPQ